jgi:hypothetical protein
MRQQGSKHLRNVRLLKVKSEEERVEKDALRLLANRIDKRHDLPND